MSILTMRIVGAASLDSGGTSRAGNSNLAITLDGCVTEQVVSACNAALEVLSRSILSLKSGLPPLRFQGGQWEFVTSCNPVFHTKIVSQGFVTPIVRLKYRLENPSWELSKKQEHHKELSLGYALVTTHTRVFITDDETEAYFPGSGALVGGNGAVVQMDPERSLDLAPDTVFNVAGRDLLVFGVGWDPLRNKTYEMMMGAGQAPDIDLVIYLVNRWGEPLYKLSPKELRALQTPSKVAEQLRFNHLRCYDSAVKLSGDSVSGAGLGDDERCAIFLPGLDMNICSILVTVSIAANARDFNYVNNVYVRLLDVETHTAEIELCRFQLPDTTKPPDHKTALLLHLSRVGGSTDFAEPVNQSEWQMRTLGNFVLSSDPARPEVLPGDIVNGLRYGNTDVPLKASAWSIGSAAQGGPYGFNIDRIQDAAQHCSPITMSFSRLVESGKTFEVTFDSDPTHQISFGPQHLRANMASAIGLSTQEGIPMVKGVTARFRPRLIPGQLSPFLGSWANTPRPDRIVIHGVRAYIPASDVSGTTDAYALVYYKKLQGSTTAQLVEALPEEITRTPVQKKLKCPAIVEFPELAVEVPIDSMNGIVPKCIIEVRDKDFNPLGFMAGMGSKGAAVASAADDCLLKHRVDLTEFVCRDASKTDEFAVMPEVVGEIMNHRSNAGFTKQMVTLLFKVTLLLPGEKAPFPTKRA